MLKLSMNLDITCKKLRKFIKKININYGKESFLIEYYDKSRFFKKIQTLRNLRLLINYNEVVGYIWYECCGDNVLTVKEFLYDEVIYNEELTPEVIRFFQKKMFIWDAKEEIVNPQIMNKFGFKLSYETYLMRLEVEKPNELEIEEDFYFSIFTKNEEESIRCSIQNEAFKDDTRIPLTLEDIYFDESQEYYIDDLCIFLRYNFGYIGYGQIIYNDNEYLIVNVGIKDNYKGKGLGKLLLNKLINLAYENNINELYIKVKKDNYIARRLYQSLSFKDIETIQTWENL